MNRFLLFQSILFEGPGWSRLSGSYWVVPESVIESLASGVGGGCGRNMKERSGRDQFVVLVHTTGLPLVVTLCLLDGPLTTRHGV